MSSIRQVLEARKAAIKREADEAMSKIDKEMAELERLADKYGLTVTTPQPKGKDGNKPVPARGEIVAELHRTLDSLKGQSTSYRAREGAKAYIKAKGRPATLSELADVLAAHGVQYVSPNPRNTLSAVLGQDDELYSISRERGWWLKNEAEPLADSEFSEMFS